MASLNDGLTARQSEHELVVDPLTIPAWRATAHRSSGRGRAAREWGRRRGEQATRRYPEGRRREVEGGRRGRPSLAPCGG